jgi:hypothetical protein
MSVCQAECHLGFQDAENNYINVVSNYTYLDVFGAQAMTEVELLPVDVNL